MRTARTSSQLTNLLGKLRAFHGRPIAPPSRDPYHLLLWEQVAYLATDERRLTAYQELAKQVGLAPTAILAAPRSVLTAIARRGGAIAVNQRVQRLRDVAERVLGVWAGNLKRVLKLPFDAARKELTKYPAIGEPGAERILLLSGAYPVLGLDSNALRVLQRLGYGRTMRSYTATYRSAQAAASAELPETVPARRQAYLLLRHHGQTLCRRTAPRCPACPLEADCPTGQHLTS
jgi:endonuclease III